MFRALAVFKAHHGDLFTLVDNHMRRKIRKILFNLNCFASLSMQKHYDTGFQLETDLQLMLVFLHLHKCSPIQDDGEDFEYDLTVLITGRNIYAFCK